VYIFASQKANQNITVFRSSQYILLHYYVLKEKNIKKVFWMQCWSTTTTLFPQVNWGVIGSMIAV